MKRDTPYDKLQKIFDAECVFDVTDWDDGGQLFSVQTSDHHTWVDGCCKLCGRQQEEPA